MSVIEKISNLSIDPGTFATLSYSAGTDVFVHNESEVETALEDTDVVDQFVNLISTPGLKASTEWHSSIIDSIRDKDLLEDYERDGTFSDYLSETIKENFYDVDLIEYSIEKYDYKRGFCTLTANLRVTVSNLIETQPSLSGWNISVPHAGGTLTIAA